MPTPPALLTELAPFFLLGFLGSLHCAGMCGGFALGVSQLAAKEARGPWFARGLYFSGKAVSYCILALLAAAGASRVTHGAAPLVSGDSPRAYLAWVVGVSLVVLGLWKLASLSRAGALFRTTRLAGLGARVQALLRPLFQALCSLPGSTRFLGMGIANGLLPCGLSWSAILLASRLPVLEAGAGALLFGLATVPALLVSSFAPELLGVRLRRHAPLALACALVALGVMTILRAAPSADCCAQHVSALVQPSEQAHADPTASAPSTHRKGT